MVEGGAVVWWRGVAVVCGRGWGCRVVEGRGCCVWWRVGLSCGGGCGRGWGCRVVEGRGCHVWERVRLSCGGGAGLSCVVEGEAVMW